MKKFLLFAVMAIMAIGASAQVEKGFRMGVQANIGLSTYDVEESVGFGYGVGWVAEYNFNPSLFFRSGVGIQDIATKDDSFDKTLNAYYLQIPLHLGYRFNINDTYSVFAHSGLSLGVGLFGTKISDGYDTYGYFDFASRFDLEAGVRIGVEFNNMQISIGVDHSLLNVFESYTNGYGNNLSANIGYTYMF